MSELKSSDDAVLKHHVFIEVMNTFISFIDVEDKNHKESINKVIKFLYNSPILTTTWYEFFFGYAFMLIVFCSLLHGITDFNSSLAGLIDCAFRFIQSYMMIVLVNTFFVRSAIKLCAMSDIKISELNIGELRLEPALKI